MAAIGRTVELKPLLQTNKITDITWLMVPEVNWAFAEGSVGIIAASIPSTRPLFQCLISKTRGGGDRKDDRSGVTLQDLSGASRGHRAHKHHHWPHSNERTLACNPEDEELGLCPSRTTHGSDRISKASDNPVSSAPHPNDARAKGGHLEGSTDASGRIEVTVADFAVAH